MGILKNNSGKQYGIFGGKKALLGIKEHLWEVEGHIDLRTRAIATSLPPLEWSFLDVSSQNRFSKFFLGALFSLGSNILILKFF